MHDESAARLRVGGFHVLQVGAVAAEQTVFAEAPQVSSLRDCDCGRLAGTFDGQLLVGSLGARLRDERVDVGLAEPDAVERVLLAKPFEDLREYGLVELS